MKQTENKHMTPTLDLSPLLEDCLGQVDMLEDLLLIYKSNIAEFFEAMDSSLAATDREGITFATHKVKCGLNMLRTQQLSGLADEMHHLNRNGACLDEIKALYGKFKRDYPVVESQLETALAILKTSP